jgi:azobenzene reductase
MILVVGGSPRMLGRTQALSNHIATTLTQLGAEVEYVNLAVSKLPIYDDSLEQNQLPEVIRWKELARQADAFFLVTPDYHNGMSGALKNAIDFLGGSHFRRKPSAIAALAGGGKGGINALNNLRLVLRGVYSLVLPDQVVVDKHQVNDQFQIIDPIIAQRVDGLAAELIVMSNLLVANRPQAN